VLDLEVLVIEGLHPIDGSAACAVAVEEISTLAHEVFDLTICKSRVFISWA
jgi:hypothetical protein